MVCLIVVDVHRERKMSEEDKKHIKVTYNDDRPFSHQTFLKAMEFNLLINFWLDNGLEGFERILREKND
jgi:hypothetical protein